MTYRSDHEAALMRVDALEAEVARLRTAAPAPVATKPRPRASAFRAAIALALVGAGVVAIVGRDRPAVVAAPAPVVVAKPIEVPKSVDSLRDCIAAIAPVTREIDASTVDPHGAADSTSWIPSTGARCRTELRDIANTPMDPDLRFQIRQWADAEDKLADPISMITVYYGNDPYALDNYESAGQLWREYHRARLSRDDALAGIRLALAR